MVNIDSRLFGTVDANGFMLLAFLTSMTNEHGKCWPSNSTICKALGWSMVRLQSTKKRLIEAGIITAEIRHSEKHPGQTSNYYTVLTPLTKNYTPTSKSDRGDTLKLGTGVIPESCNRDTSKLGTAPASKLGNEVLEDEALSNEELEREALETKQREEAWERNRTEDIIYKYQTALFPEVNMEATDSLSKTITEKIHTGAREIIEYFKANPKPCIPAFRLESTMFSKEDEYCPFTEAKDQIKAYADYTRLTGIQYRANIDNTPQKIVLTDWCQKLLDHAEERFYKEYDPAYDVDLESYWLLENFYDVGIAYADKRHKNRELIPQ